MWAQIAPHTDTSNRTGSADWDAERAKPALANAPDGFQLGGDIASEDIETEHRYRGTRYTILTQRNAGQKTLTSPLFPERAGLLLNLPIAETAAGLPKYHQARQYWEPGVVFGMGIGRQSTGIIGKSLGLSFDRGSPAGLSAQLGVFINRDSEIKEGPGLSTDVFVITAVSAANPAVVTTSTAHGFSNADRVYIRGVVGNTGVNGMIKIAAVTATTFEMTGVDTTGQTYVSGGQVFKAYQITGASNATPVVLTVTAHDFVIGDTIYVEDVATNTGANGTWEISAVGANTITLRGSVGNGVYGAATGGALRTPGPGTSSSVALTFPTYNPYVTSATYIDLGVADSSGNFPAWAGNNPDVRSLNFSYDNNAELDVFSPNDNADLNQVWTKVFSGTPSLTLQFVLIFAKSDYLNFHRIAGIRKFRARIMAVGATPSGSTTTSNSESAGATVIEVPDTTGFLAGDVVLLNDAVNGKQSVATVASLIANTSLTMTAGIDTDIAAGSTVKNTAWEIKVNSADMKTAPILGNQNQVKGVTIDGEAKLTAALTTIVSVQAYDHLISAH